MTETQSKLTAGPPPVQVAAPPSDHLTDPLASASATPQAGNSQRQVSSHQANHTVRGGPGDKKKHKPGDDGVSMDGEVGTAKGVELAERFGGSHSSLSGLGSVDVPFTMPYEGEGSADIFTSTARWANAADAYSTSKEFAKRLPDVRERYGSQEEAWGQAQLHDHNMGGSHYKMGSKKYSRGAKRAVVVGNSDYKRKTYLPLAKAAAEKAGDKRDEFLVADLGGAGRDAKTVAGIYKGLGFDVIEHSDQESSSLNKTLQGAEEGLVEGDELLIYYAGHGTTTGLIGAEANRLVTKNNDWGPSVVPFAAALDAVIAAKMGNFHVTVVLDACNSGGATADLEDQGAELGAAEPHQINLAEEALRDNDGDMKKASKQLNFTGQLFNKWSEKAAERLPGSK